MRNAGIRLHHEARCQVHHAAPQREGGMSVGACAEVASVFYSLLLDAPRDQKVMEYGVCVARGEHVDT
jgi:hypothetical protein